MTIKAIDFFCGAGGLTRGLLDAGIAVVGGVDSDERARETYERNNAPSRFIHAGVENVDANALRAELGIGRADAVLYAACSPCQPFSNLNSAKAKPGRKALLLDFARIVQDAPPDFILIENVPGLKNSLGDETRRAFAAVIERMGFAVESGVLDAKNYGVPQTRKRFILTASRTGEASLPAPALLEKPPRTVRSQIAKFPRLSEGETSSEYPNHRAKKLSARHKRIVEAVPLDGGSRSDVDESALLEHHRRSPQSHKDVFGRMAWDMPSPTLTTRCVDVYCGRFIHPEQHRGITPREAASLQTFPDDYEFFGKSFLENSRYVGNAVPVELAKRLGKSILAAAS